MSELKEPTMLQYEYARTALKSGLKLKQELGSNPYQFGMVGSTDSHTGLSTAEEDNFFGKMASNEPPGVYIADLVRAAITNAQTRERQLNDSNQHPLISSPHRLKLAVFGLNVSSDCSWFLVVR